MCNYIVKVCLQSGWSEPTKLGAVVDKVTCSRSAGTLARESLAHSRSGRSPRNVVELTDKFGQIERYWMRY
ncbi:hypothetical protein [Altericista sp. CCNU0014]|uniref:hypothetical protein n=1 Tax=Altericista sp. CCNU0014 TaxID=3082949 RepID=UPI00384D1579